MHCGQTVTYRLMIHLQSDRASTWVAYVRHQTASKSVKSFSTSGGLSGPTLCSVLQTSAPASKRCEIGIIMVTMKHYCDVDVLLSESAKKVTFLI